jgi:nucleotide-binding universal stress UspA family protein
LPRGGSAQRSAAPIAVVGYDGSQGAKRALAAAAAGVGTGGRVFVVVAAASEEQLEREDVRAEEEQVRRLLAEAVAYLDEVDVRAMARVIEADPVDALVDVARKTGAQVIAVGARGDNFLARTLRGSVSQRLVARAPCDLLVMR